ncbi:MAG: DUF1501 domain-containing protein [Bacteroidota bacterium]
MTTGLASLFSSFFVRAPHVYAGDSAPLMRQLRHSPNRRTLVLIQLKGGNDGLNTIIPYEQDAYYNARPTLAIPKANALVLNDDFGMHPSMQALRPMWQSGKMAVVHGTGYTESSRSHFTGTDNWMTGSSTTERFGTGWLGRHLEATEPVIDPIELGGEPLAVSFGSTKGLFQGTSSNLSIGQLRNSSTVRNILSRGVIYPVDGLDASTPLGQSLRHTRSVTNTLLVSVVRFVQETEQVQNYANYGTYTLGRDMALAARVVRSGLAPRIITVSINGFDTHRQQGGLSGKHADLWQRVSESVAAFYRDLAQDHLDRNVLVMTFSEFGRKMTENGSAGTDHGLAAPMLLFNSHLNGGFHGTHPDLVNGLDDRGESPKFTTDYRSVYASVLEDWLLAPSATVDGVMGGAFARLDLVRDSIPAPEDPILDDLTVANGNTYTIGRLEEGIRYYQDRDYTLTSLPDPLGDAAFIRTRNDDKSATDDALVSFRMREGGKVFVGYDPRATALPAWLAGWTLEPSQIGVDEGGTTHLNIYSKEVAPGLVTLGGNLASPASGAQTNYIVAAVSQAALPVELVTFRALRAGQAVRLAWETATETNNAGFHVERALGTGAFSVLGFVEGYGTTLAAQRYQFTDDTVVLGAPTALRYRLRQVDYDGTSEYSPIVEVAPEAPTQVTLEPNYPNPFTASTRLRYRLNQTGPVTLAVYDVQGRLVASLVDDVQEPGTYEVTLDGRALSSGAYLCRLTTPNGVRTRKLTRVR